MHACMNCARHGVPIVAAIANQQYSYVASYNSSSYRCIHSYILYSTYSYWTHCKSRAQFHTGCHVRNRVYIMFVAGSGIQSPQTFVFQDEVLTSIFNLSLSDSFGRSLQKKRINRDSHYRILSLYRS